MPEPVTTGSGADQLTAPPPDGRATQDSIRLTVSQVVLSTPGVVRLEPTLSTAGPKILLHRSPTDGVRVLNRSNILEIDVNIATETTHQARRVARDVHHKVTAEMAKLGRPGTIKVNVLTIDEATGPS